MLRNTVGLNSCLGLKWQGKELVTDNKDTYKSGTSPSFEINQCLTNQMGWVIQRKTDFLYTLGPNLRQEFFDDIVPHLTDSVVDLDVLVAPNKAAFRGKK